MKQLKETITHERNLEDIVANINNECRCCSAEKDCSICVWKYK